MSYTRYIQIDRAWRLRRRREIDREFEDVFLKKVLIKNREETGIIVDISIHEGRLFYLVEADERNSEGIFPIYDCLREDLVFE